MLIISTEKKEKTAHLSRHFSLDKNAHFPQYKRWQHTYTERHFSRWKKKRRVQTYILHYCSVQFCLLHKTNFHNIKSFFALYYYTDTALRRDFIQDCRRLDELKEKCSVPRCVEVVKYTISIGWTAYTFSLNKSFVRVERLSWVIWHKCLDLGSFCTRISNRINILVLHKTRNWYMWRNLKCNWKSTLWKDDFIHYTNWLSTIAASLSSLIYGMNWYIISSHMILKCRVVDSKANSLTLGD